MSNIVFGNDVKLIMVAAFPGTETTTKTTETQTTKTPTTNINKVLGRAHPQPPTLTYPTNPHQPASKQASKPERPHEGGIRRQPASRPVVVTSGGDWWW